MSISPAAQLRKSRRPKFIYFARVGDYIKVGCSYNPQQRIKQIRRGCLMPADLDMAAPVELLRTVPAGSGPGAFTVEFHHLAALFDYRTAGEWFHADPAVLEWIERLDPDVSVWEQNPPLADTA